MLSRLRTPAVSLILVLLWLAPLSLALRFAYPFEHDSVNYAVGLSRFDILTHQPHPPGYPYWIMTVRPLFWLGLNPYQAQALAAFLFTVAAIVTWVRSAPDLLRSTWPLLAFSPAAWLSAGVPSNYSVDLFFGCAVLPVLERAWNGSARAAWWGAILVGVWGGFRASSAVFLLPLLAAAAWRARALPSCLAIFGALSALWYVPVVLSAGGFLSYSAAMHSMTEPFFRKTSLFYGASARSAFMHTLQGLVFVAFTVGPIILGALLSRRRKNARLSQIVFGVLSFSPALAFLLLIHGPKAGYFLILLPGFLWVAGESVELRTPAVLAGVVLACVLSWFPYERILPLPDAFALTRATPRVAFLIDAAHRAIVRAAPTRGSVSTDRAEGPNPRTLQAILPAARWNQSADPCWMVTNPWVTPPGAENVAASPVFALWKMPCAGAP